MTKFVSKFVADAYLNWLRGTTFPAAPANTYVALYTAAPTSRDATGGTEVTGGSYARVAVPSSGWGAISTNGSGLTLLEQIVNSSAITFPTATANWGTVVGAGLLDAATNGNLLDYGDLSASQTINNGGVFQLNSSNYTVQA